MATNSTATATAAAASSSTSNGGPGTGQPRWVRANARTATQRALAPIPTSPRGRQGAQIRSLLIEGSAFLGNDTGAAAAALSHLSSCVAAERKLREQLEAARKERLQAFRGVVRVCVAASRCQDGEGIASRPTAGNASDKLALARCAVVTNTLAVTIQGYLRAQQSRQLCAALRHLRRVLGVSPQSVTDYNTTLSLRSLDGGRNLQASTVSALCTWPTTMFDATTASSEDVLDTSEVARLKQLYFDYYDCEMFSLSALGESNAIANGFAPPDRDAKHRSLAGIPSSSRTIDATMTSSAAGDVRETASVFSSTM